MHDLTIDRRTLPSHRDRRADAAAIQTVNLGGTMLARSPGRRSTDVIVIPEYVVKSAVPPVATFVEDGPYVMASGQRIR